MQETVGYLAEAHASFDQTGLSVMLGDSHFLHSVNSLTCHDYRISSIRRHPRILAAQLEALSEINTTLK